MEAWLRSSTIPMETIQRSKKSSRPEQWQRTHALRLEHVTMNNEHLENKSAITWLCTDTSLIEEKLHWLSECPQSNGWLTTSRTLHSIFVWSMKCIMQIDNEWTAYTFELSWSSTPLSLAPLKSSAGLHCNMNAGSRQQRFTQKHMLFNWVRET